MGVGQAQENKTHQIVLFFVKDKVDSGKQSIEHQLTNKMWLDMLTKPKQGIGFQKDRVMLMNMEEACDNKCKRKRTHQSLLPGRTKLLDADLSQILA